MANALIISNSNELVRLMSYDIVCITADHNYSNVFTANGDEVLATLQLGQIADQILNQLKEEAPQFIRIGRSLIINRNYIYRIDLKKGTLELKSPFGKCKKINVTHDPLTALKKLIESELNNP